MESYVALSSCQFPLIRKYGPYFLNLGGNAARIAAKYTYFKHFCGGETLQENTAVVEKLHHLGIKCILDYSVEGAVSTNSIEPLMDEFATEKREDEITETIIDSIRFLKRENERILGKDSTDVSLNMLPCPMAVVKFTGISDCNLLIRVSEILSYIQQFPKSRHTEELLKTQFVHYNSNIENSDISKDDFNEILKIWTKRQSRTPAFIFSENSPPKGLDELQLLKWKRVLARIDNICNECKKNNIGLLIDAEQSWVQPAIDLMAILQTLKYNTGVSAGRRPLVHNTYQLYLKDAFNRLQFDHEFITNHNNSTKHGVKLVRGAYMQSETKRCNELHLPYPFNNSIEETHGMYHRGVNFLLQNVAKSDNIACVIATHNPDTLVLATRFMQQYRLLNNDSRILFAQLYGMGDSLSLSLATNGYNIAKYVPFGPVNEVLPYLSRRLAENGDIMSGSAVETQRLKSEICYRTRLSSK
jgi:proline dehydrogenase